MGQRRFVFAPLLFLTLIVSAVLMSADAALRTPAAPSGIIAFELAGTVPVAARILESWDAPARAWAAFSLGIDFLYLGLYSTTIALGCLWAGRQHRLRGSRLARLAPWIAWGQWMAAVLDGVENVALLVLLFGGVAAPWPAIAWWCAVPKFALVLAGLLYALSGAIHRLARPRPWR